MTSKDAHLEQLPHVLYRIFDGERRLLYVGITCRPANRLAKHMDTYGAEMSHIAVTHFDTRTAALLAERAAIVSEMPRDNLAHSGSTLDPFRGLPADVVRLHARTAPDDAIRAAAREAAREARLMRVVRALNDAGAPMEMGARSARQLLRDAGMKVPNEVICHALRLRKATA